MTTKRDALVMWLWGLAAILAVNSTAWAQDFQRNYRVAENGTIRIVTVSGDIRVQGYDGADVVVVGTRLGGNPESVEIVDRSAPDHVDVGVRYPERGGSNASANFLVKVPRRVRYNFSDVQTMSGNIFFTDVTGIIWAHCLSGSVEMRNVSGIIKAESVSGNVDVDLKKVEGEGDMRFVTVSGNVSVRAPASLTGYISMQTELGSLTTDFPIEIQEHRYAPGRSARGRLGAGNSSIVIRSVSGRVSLLKN